MQEEHEDSMGMFWLIVLDLGALPELPDLEDTAARLRKVRSGPAQ